MPNDNETSTTTWGTYRVAWEYPDQIGEYHSGVMTLLEDAEAYEQSMVGGDAHTWIESATWSPLPRRADAL